MKQIKLLTAISCAMLLASSAYASEGDMLVRVRAVNLGFKNSTNTAALAGVNASNKTIPEVDISYFFTNNIAAELILTYPQKVTINPNIGSVKALPPTLTVQYHFMPDSASFRPYVGAGINYTIFSGYSLLAGKATGSSSSFGGALQAGFDIPLTSTMTFNVDIKKVYMKTDVSTAAGYAGTLKLDPLLIGVGLGWKF